MNETKYVLTDETKVVNDCITLHRIKYVKSFGHVEEGQLGGWIESERNLSQVGNCCIFGHAMVYGNAQVYGDAEVYDNVIVYGIARVCGDATVYGNAEVHGNAEVCGNAQVHGNAHVHGDARVYGDTHVCGNAQVYGNTLVYGNARVYDAAEVCGNTLAYGNTRVCGDAEVCGYAEITKTSDYMFITGLGSQNRTTTFFKTKDNNIGVVCGCFYGTIEEFREKVKERHGDTKYAKEYLLIADVAELRLSNKEDKENG